MEKEKLNELKKKFITLATETGKLKDECKELTEEEIKEISGGDLKFDPLFDPKIPSNSSDTCKWW